MTRVVEKYYSIEELRCLVGFSDRFWRERAQAGDLTLRDGDNNTLAEPLLIAGELRIPAAAVNAYLARHPYRTAPGIAARTPGELRRKLSNQVEPATAG